MDWDVLLSLPDDEVDWAIIKLLTRPTPPRDPVRWTKRVLWRRRLRRERRAERSEPLTGDEVATEGSALDRAMARQQLERMEPDLLIRALMGGRWETPPRVRRALRAGVGDER